MKRQNLTNRENQLLVMKAFEIIRIKENKGFRIEENKKLLEFVAEEKCQDSYSQLKLITREV